MDLNTVTAVAHPTTRAQLPVWTAGDAWLAGGTWLFSEPQAHLKRLIDLTDLKWPALTISETGLSIAATCTVAQLDALACPPDWIASPLINQCCRAFLASFKSEQKIPVVDFVTGDQRNVLASGDLLRQIEIPLAALRQRSAFRQISLTPVGRSAALLIGSVTSDGGLALTITASTKRPVRLSFAGIPNSKELRETILQRIADDLYHSDGHGKPIWRKHMTLRLAEEIRVELQGTAYA